jgi:hypothetical protein
MGGSLVIESLVLVAAHVASLAVGGDGRPYKHDAGGERELLEEADRAGD